MTKITKLNICKEAYQFKIFIYPNEYTKTVKGITKKEADLKAWGWINEGFHEKVGNKTVCGDGISLVEIRKVKDG